MGRRRADGRYQYCDTLDQRQRPRTEVIFRQEPGEVPLSTGSQVERLLRDLRWGDHETAERGLCRPLADFACGGIYEFIRVEDSKGESELQRPDYLHALPVRLMVERL